jgi:hypothetical protein
MTHIEYIHIQKIEKKFEQRTKLLFLRCACAWMQTCYIKKIENTKKHGLYEKKLCMSMAMMLDLLPNTLVHVVPVNR